MCILLKVNSVHSVKGNLRYIEKEITDKKPPIKKPPIKKPPIKKRVCVSINLQIK